jgi:hypothetical protein
MKASIVYLSILGQPACPASMCPLFAKDGSPWTGQKNARCPQHEDYQKSDGCAFWAEGQGCDGAIGAIGQVEEALETGGTLQIGPVRQKRHEVARPTEFDCAKASSCQWQIQVAPKLCPPRYALSLGVDPRACAY